MKIGFIYYTFYPVTGGASVHGYNLAKELTELGYKLYKINGDPDPYTHLLKNRVAGIFWMLANCDLIYIRMDYFLNFRNLISLLSLISGKKLIVELNNPSDELHLFGRGKTYIRMADRIISKILHRADAVITVSEPLKTYCKEALKLTENVHVIENGGQIFPDELKGSDEKIKKKILEIKKNYSNIVVWSGSSNSMQDLSDIQTLAKAQEGRSAFILIIHEDREIDAATVVNENLFIFKNLPRNDVKYIIASSDVGLALYNEYPWSRWGFYNSSLKIFEYLNNGLLTISNKSGTPVQQSYPNFVTINSTKEIISVLDRFNKSSFNLENPRTWSDVARETSTIIQQVANRA